jgi:hypothetical protein
MGRVSGRNVRAESENILDSEVKCLYCRHSEFYLVLDVLNQTQQEAELCYAEGKSMLVEGDEFCRVPVPLPKCPLEKLSKVYSSHFK